MAQISRLLGLKRQAKREGWLAWIRSEADERAMLDGCWFDIEAGNDVVDFFEGCLCLTEGHWADEPFILMDWQHDEIIMPLFGWYRESEDFDGMIVRRYKKCYCEVPKKNGKSPFAAGIGLYMFCGDEEPGAKCFSGATDEKQAAIVHDHAINMARGSRMLKNSLKINNTTKAIQHLPSNSSYKIMSKQVFQKEGLNGNCLIADELHVWKGRAMYNALKYMGISRVQPLIFMITTAGDDPLSVCKEQHDYAKGIAEGKYFDEQYLPFIRAADPDDDIEDLEVQKKSNPSLGVTIGRKQLQSDIQEAKQSPLNLATLKRYRFNIWQTSENPWIHISKWNRCKTGFTEEDLLRRDAFGGLDLSKTEDMTSFSLLFPEEGSEVIRQINKFWLPEATIKKYEQVVPFEYWIKLGLVKVTDGEVCDYSVVEEDILELNEMFNIKEFAYDPWNADFFTKNLENAGMQRYSFAQNIGNYAEPTEEYERRVINGTIQHNGNAIMDWQMGHVAVKTDVSGNKRPIKPKPQDPRKIDGVVSSIMALGRAIGCEEEYFDYQGLAV